jgi:hypothetical protein
VVTHLYALGCSWTEGTDDEFRLGGWVGRLADKLGCEYTNLGGQGDSNWLQYLSFLKQPIHKDSIAVWGLTAFSRLINSKFQTISNDKFDSNFMLKYYSDEAVQYQSMVMLHSWQTYCMNNNIDCLAFVSFDDLKRIDGTYNFDNSETVYSLLNKDKIITNTTMRSFLDGDRNRCGEVDESLSYVHKKYGRQTAKDRVNLKYFSKDGHPNANGYSLWADELYRRINEN